MREALALLRASWLMQMSYRVDTLLSLTMAVATTIPVYFMTNALQPFLGPKIQTLGDRYFAFVIIGIITQAVLTAALFALPQAVTAGIANGTLEALLSTPARLSSVLTGLSLYSFAWTGVRIAIILAAAIVLGVHVRWEHALASILVLLLIIAAHVPVSILSAATVVAYRSPGPLPQIALAASALLGGIYYPTHVLPGGLRHAADLLPLTYGLRALRRVTLEGWSFAAVAPDVAILAAIGAGLLATSLLAFTAALRYARRTGTLAQY
jgi:ABC-2 type transport system permease protein